MGVSSRMGLPPPDSTRITPELPSEGSFSASEAVIAVVLLERVQLVAQVVGPPLEEIANGKDAEHSAGRVDNRKMSKMTLNHYRERLSRADLV